MAASGEVRATAQRNFALFLDQDHALSTRNSKYVRRIDAIAKAYPETHAARLEVDLQDLEDYSVEMHEALLKHPLESLGGFEAALGDAFRELHPKTLDPDSRVHVAVSGEFGARSLSPRELTARQLGRLVQVTGIVTKCSLVHPKLVKSAHWCRETNSLSFREFHDAAEEGGAASQATTVYPTRDAEGHRLTTQHGLSRYVDHQTMTIQELPERAPPGQLPRSVDVVLEDDLRDACKPGDRVTISGVYAPRAPSANGACSGIFRATLAANRVTRRSAAQGSPALSEGDYDNIVALSREPDVVEQLASSLAPSIYGYSAVKKALVLFLAGGRERTLANGAHLRGDLNCLLVGDPGVAKSQLLRAVMAASPLAVSTTGRGSSGVGLTAAVTTDSETGERRLEAGAMVLADRGVVCIDEFDKMSDGDRTAIHEVMEQQTVSIAKAGIMTQLHARCSVLAAANPVYGNYDRSLSVTRNVGLPDSLLSRFDVLFVVLDARDQARDRDVAEHVLGQHRWRARGDDGTRVGQGVGGGAGGGDEDASSDDEGDEPGAGDASGPLDAAFGGDGISGPSRVKTTVMRVPYDARLYGPRRAGRKDPLSLPFLRKYLAFAKARCAAPELTKRASEDIARVYADLRSSPEVRALPVTVRTLETLIRLSCAHAKLRLSTRVEQRDARAAVELLDLVLKADPGDGSASGAGAGHLSPASRKGAKRTIRDDDDEEGGASGDESSSDDDEALSSQSEDEVVVAAGAGSRGRRAAARDAAAGPSAEPSSSSSLPPLLDRVSAAVRHISSEAPASANVAAVLGVLAAEGSASTYDEVVAALQTLADRDVLMFQDDEFFLTQ